MLFNSLTPNYFTLFLLFARPSIASWRKNWLLKKYTPRPLRHVAWVPASGLRSVGWVFITWSKALSSDTLHSVQKWANNFIKSTLAFTLWAIEKNIKCILRRVWCKILDNNPFFRFATFPCIDIQTFHGSLIQYKFKTLQLWQISQLL